MKKLFLALLLLSSPAFAGMKYSFDDPKLNDEFEKNYKEHSFPNWVNARGSSVTITSKATVPLATSATDAVRFSQLHLLQAPVMGVSTTAKSTTATTYQATSLTASITPTSASSKILIFVGGTFNCALTDNCYATVLRGSANVAGSTSGLATNVTSERIQTAMLYLDSPSTTTATAYTVAIRTFSGGATAIWGDDALSTQVMILMEVQ